jgi:hypothetical protein
MVEVRSQPRGIGGSSRLLVDEVAGNHNVAL